MHPSGISGPAWARPRLVVSRCLDLDACRYNGALIRTPLVRRLEAFVDLVPICPEVEIGLGVPRDPVRLVRRGAATALLQPASGRDLTGAMAAFSSRFLDALPDVDGFLLKARSPSCGIHGVKLFPDAATEDPEGRGAGMFAREVLARFPDHPVEHEGRLGNARLRDHFLTRLFALADVRRARAQDGSVAALRALHARRALALLALSPEPRAVLDRIVGDAAAPDADRAWSAYAVEMRAGLARAPSPGDHLAVMESACAVLERQADVQARRGLAALMRGYREGEVPRPLLIRRLRALLLSSGAEALARDAYLSPYPDELGLDA